MIFRVEQDRTFEFQASEFPKIAAKPTSFKITNLINYETTYFKIPFTVP